MTEGEWQGWERQVVWGLPQECWGWAGDRFADGVPRFWIQDPSKWDVTGPTERRVGQPAAIFAWERHRGEPVPEGWGIRLHCGNRACLNPAHMEPYRWARPAPEEKEKAKAAKARVSAEPWGQNKETLLDD